MSRTRQRRVVVTGCRQLADPRAVSVLGDDVGRGLRREPGLSHSADTDDRHESGVVYRAATKKLEGTLRCP